jgi:hypothetical protein
VVEELRIDGLALKDYTVNVAGKEIRDANGVAVFQLGADILAHFTVEFDLAHGVVRLLRPQDCKPEQLAYWSASYFQANLKPVYDRNAMFIFEAKVNGKAMLARLVSGSAVSSIRPQTARDLGVAPGGPNAAPAGDITGLAAKSIPTWVGRFDTVEVGGESIRNAHLQIGEVFPGGRTEITGSVIGFQYSGSEDLKLGADFLRAHRLIIVPEKHLALFTYNGGDVHQPQVPDRPN